MNSIADALTAWLTQQVRTLPQGAALPSGTELSVRFSVSVRTVHRAMKAFIRSGAVMGVRGRGWIIGTPPVPSPGQPAPHTSSSERLAAILERAILQGTLKSGTVMPQLKFVSANYRVGYVTAVKAYRRLRQKRLIMKSGKSFIVGREVVGAVPGGPRHAYLFRHGTPDFSMVFNDNYLGRAYRRLEQELNAHGYKVHYESMSALADLVRHWQQGTRALPSAFVFCALRQQTFSMLTPRLRRALDALGTSAPPVLFDLQEQCAIVQFPGSSILHRYGVIRSAVSSLADAVCRHGAQSVTVFMTEGGMVWHHAGASLPLLRFYTELRKRLPECGIRFIIKPKKNTADYRRFLTGTKLPEQIRGHSSRSQTRTVREAIHATCTITATPEDRFSVPEGKTMWIFDRDGLAAKAHSWAGNNGVRIPEQLGLIGLEEAPRFFHIGLSYTGPDWDTIGHQMAHAVIGDVPVSKTARGYLSAIAVNREKLTT